jgi:hypothetical protein
MGSSSSSFTPTPPTEIRSCPSRPCPGVKGPRCEKFCKVTSRKQIKGGGPYTITIKDEEIFASVPTTVWPLVFAGTGMLHFGVVAEGKWIFTESQTHYKYCLSHVMPDKNTGRVTLRVEFTNDYKIVKETIKRCSGQTTGTSIEGPPVLINPMNTPLSAFNKVAEIVFNARDFKLPMSPPPVDKDGKINDQKLITSSVSPDHVKHYNYVNCKRYFQSVASVFGLDFPPELDLKLKECGWKLDDTVKAKETTGMLTTLKTDLISSAAS